ncbi:MAG: phage holin family protein [Chloroflexi bacterium]|nr:phage holin family protein [Chloroflexota bacterium]
MTKFVIRWGINAAALYAAIAILPGLDFRGEWVGIVFLALIFGFVNALLRPLLKLLTCPLIVLTLGLFTLVINTFLFWLTGEIGQGVGLNLVISEPVFWNAFLGALIVSIISIILSLILKDELKGRKKKK